MKTNAGYFLEVSVEGNQPSSSAFGRHSEAGSIVEPLYDVKRERLQLCLIRGCWHEKGGCRLARRRAP